MRMKLFAAAALVLAARVGWAQPVADQVPADSMLYVGWAGTDVPPAGFEGSHLQSLLNTCNIRQVFSDTIPKLARRASQINPQVGEQIELALGVISPMLRHPSALYVERVDINNREPAISAGLICQAGNDIEDLDRKLGMLKAQLPHSEWFTWQKSGSTISIHLGYLPVGTHDMLSGSADFKNTVGQIHADSPLLLYANVDAMLKTVDSGVAQVHEPQLTEYWPKVRDALGIDGIKSLAWCSHFEGRNWMDEMFVSAPAPRHGLVSIGDVSGKLSPDTLACVPATANFVSASTLDLGKGLALLRDSTNAVDPQAGHVFDQALGALTLFIGRNFQHDVVEPFGPQWVMYTDPTRNGSGMAGIILANRPNDLRKADGALTSFAIAISNTTAGLMRQWGLSVPLERSKFGQTNVSYLGLPLLTFAWTTAGDRLYMGLYPQVAASAARYGASPTAPITEDANFKAAIAKLGVEQPTSLMYSDLKLGASESYQMLLVGSRLFFGFADAWGVKAPEPIVPAYEDLVKELEPVSAAGWVDDAGFHMKSISPFPMSGLLSGGNSGALIQGITSFASSATPAIMEAQRHHAPPPMQAEPQQSPEPQVP